MNSSHLYLAHGIAVASIRKIFKGVIEPIVYGERSWGSKQLRKRIGTRLFPVLELFLDVYKFYKL